MIGVAAARVSTVREVAVWKSPYRKEKRRSGPPLTYVGEKLRHGLDELHRLLMTLESVGDTDDSSAAHEANSVPQPRSAAREERHGGSCASLGQNERVVAFGALRAGKTDE